MKLIRPSTQILQPEGYGVNEILKFITSVAYTCYKTEKEITVESAKEFVNRLVNSGHTAMLEHGTVYLRIPYGFIHRLFHPGLISKYENNKYSRVNFGYEIIGSPEIPGHDQSVAYAYITTNFRVIYENHWQEDLEHYLCKPTRNHDIRRTVKFITDRGVSHELVRHRVFSFAQESTRYCNYGKDKFGNEITFIIPSWVENQDEINYKHDPHNIEERDMLKEDFGRSYGAFLHQLCLIEDEYLYQLDNGWTPQQARQILPNALKTEIVLTAFESDWVHFFNLRALGLTGKPHPDMLNLAEPLFSQFLETFPSFTKIFNEIHKNL